MSFPRYPKYKDSGVEWLGQVPEHWEVLRMKHIKQVIEQGWSPQCEGFATETDDEWAVLKVGCVNGGTFRASENKVLPTDLKPEPALAVLRGDLLISRANTRELVGSAAAVSRDHEKLMLCDKLYRVRFRPGDASPWFIALYLGASAVRGQLELAATGSSDSMLNITQSAILELPTACPPLPEQTTIAAFLDRETAKIDALVAEQERLIELLKEKRQAVISHAVTKGLNPDAPMKDSGVEWLGEIPAHWDLERGRFLYNKLEIAPQANDGVVTAFRDGQVTLRENRRTDGYTLAVLEAGYQRVRQGDLVVHGMDAFAGAIGVSESTGKCTPEYSVLAPAKPGIVNQYFAMVLRLMAQRDYILVICPSVRERAPRFRYEAIKDVLLPVPPEDEQTQIVNYAEAYITRAVALITEAQRAIELLQERRTALISAAVTGQIDVRDVERRAA